jgi:cell division ATPase FtsA
MEEIDTMVAKIEVKSLEKAEPKILTRILRANTRMKLVTTTLTSIIIDGKKVSNPVGFTGKNVSLTVCNVFVPVSIFHLYSGIERTLGLDLISFVPVGVVLPKALENSLELFDPNLCIDIGYSTITVTLENYSEILGSLTIPFGSQVLEDIFSRKEPALSRLEVQHRIIDAKEKDSIFQSAQIEYQEILRDTIRVAIREIAPDATVRNIYISG